MKATKTSKPHLWATLACLMVLGGGCKGLDLGPWNWFDPSKPLRTPEQATINPIFPQVGLTDQTQELLPNAVRPSPEDLRFDEEDYVIGATDILRISVLDLLQEGMETVLERQVSESGFIDMPLLGGALKASGLTREQLVQRIRQAYMPDVLIDPTVSVSVVVQRQNTFSVLGAVPRPGTYSIFQKDFTLYQAIALAGDISQFNIEWLYIIRHKRPQPAKARPADEGVPKGLPPLPAIPDEHAPPVVPSTGTAPGTETKPAPENIDERLKELEKFIPGAMLRPGAGWPAVDERISLSQAGNGPLPASAGAGFAGALAPEKWIYTQGKWVRVAHPGEPAKAPATAPGSPAAPEVVRQERDAHPEDPFNWMEADLSGSARIIAINVTKLKNGEARENIIIKPNDIVHVPPLEIGEFYVMGEVLRPGVYSLTGRRVTAKMAVAAAGNLGALAWPNNSILIRRIGRDQEQIQQLKLNDIMAGKEPDIFLKPNDVVAVGSYWAAPFLAVWRNAFRMTYGFGFIYDRNYSDREFEIPLLSPNKGFR